MLKETFGLTATPKVERKKKRHQKGLYPFGVICSFLHLVSFRPLNFAEEYELHYAGVTLHQNDARVRRRDKKGQTAS